MATNVVVIDYLYDLDEFREKYPNLPEDIEDTLIGIVTKWNDRGIINYHQYKIRWRYSVDIVLEEEKVWNPAYMSTITTYENAVLGLLRNMFDPEYKSDFFIWDIFW